MPKLCNGQSNNQAVNPRNSKSFCEGLKARHSDGSVVAGDNPHISGSSDALSWDRGRIVADSAGGGQINPDDAPCCAVPSSDVPAAQAGS